MRTIKFIASNVNIGGHGNDGALKVEAMMNDDDFNTTLRYFPIENILESQSTPELLEKIPINRIFDFLEDMGLKNGMDDDWNELTPEADANFQPGEYLFRATFGDEYACFIRGSYHKYNSMPFPIFEFQNPEEIIRIENRTGYKKKITHFRYLTPF